LAHINKLIVGLGNPGKQYENTRHNLGFCVVESLAERWGISLKSGIIGNGLVARKSLGHYNVFLLSPMTFMNRSGDAVRLMARQLEFGVSDVLVVCDDLHLPFGSLRLRSRGSSGGHKGLASIAECFESNDFSRLRMGIGLPKANCDVIEFVLARFSIQESAQIGSFIEKATDCCVVWADAGVERAMDVFNRKNE
jgi:peptidyl-tRNA hydrolase, PTH1 family